jgi:hypothetical protein
VNPKTTAVILGGVIGAVVGAGAAWTYVRQQESKAELANFKAPPTIEAGAGDFIKIGLAVLGLLKMFDELFKPKR